MVPAEMRFSLYMADEHIANQEAKKHFTCRPRTDLYTSCHSHCTVRIAGLDVRPLATHTTVPPSASLRTPLKVSRVLSPPLTVTISIPVKVVPDNRGIADDDPLGVNDQPTSNDDPPLSSAVHVKETSSPSATAVS